MWQAQMDYYYLNYEQHGYDNPQYIDIESDATITVNYATQADVTIRAIDLNTYTELSNLEVDCNSQCFGYTSIQDDTSLAVGTYTFSMPYTCYYVFVNNQLYDWGNSIDLFVGPSTTVIDFYVC